MSMCWKVRALWLAGLSVLIAGTAVRSTMVAASVQLEGVWKTVEVAVDSPTPRIVKPSATLAIFHGSHYSRVEVHAEGPRAVLKDAAAASADELRATWGPFFGEAGTFEVEGNKLTMQALVAKNPSAMAKGATSVYTYERNGDRLTLTQVRGPAGPITNPVTVTLLRIE